MDCRKLEERRDAIRTKAKADMIALVKEAVSSGEFVVHIGCEHECDVEFVQELLKSNSINLEFVDVYWWTHPETVRSNRGRQVLYMKDRDFF